VKEPAGAVRLPLIDPTNVGELSKLAAKNEYLIPDPPLPAAVIVLYPTISLVTVV
jgi:hypothetical protein